MVARITIIMVLIAALAAVAVGVARFGRPYDAGAAAAEAFDAAIEPDPLRRTRLRPELALAWSAGYDPRYWREPAPTWRLRTDPRGLRLADGLREPDPAVRVRIVAVGDERTLGWGLDDVRTWPARLEAMLNEGLDAPVFEVINAGVPGYTSVQGRVYFETELASLAPDVLIVAFGAEDARPCAANPSVLFRLMPESDIYRRDPVTGGWLPIRSIFRMRPAAEDGPIDGVIRQLWRRFVGRTGVLYELYDEGTTEEPCRNVPIDRYRRSLQALVGWTRARGADALLVRLGRQPSRYRTAMREVAAEGGAGYLDGRASIRELGPLLFEDDSFAEARERIVGGLRPEALDRWSTLRYTIDRELPNEIGSAIVAERIAVSAPLLAAMTKLLDRGSIGDADAERLERRLVRGYEAAGNLPAALDAAARLLARRTGDCEVAFDVYRLRGAIAQAQKRLDEAAWNFGEALRCPSDRLALWVAVAGTSADVNLDRGDVDAVLAVVERGLARAPDDARLTNYLGVARVRQKKYAEGAELLERAHRTGYQDARSSYHLGVAFERLRKIAEARQAWREAWRLEPDGEWAKRAVERLPKEYDRDGRYEHLGGHAYLFTPPPVYRGDNPDAPEVSWLALFEEKRLLGPAHAPVELIETLGLGRYRHWDDKVIFSTSDNSDPNTNGRDYYVQFR